MPSAQRLSRIFLLSIVIAAVVAVVPDSRPGPGAQPARSIPDTRVTVHSEDTGNTFGPNGLSIGSSRHVSSSK